MLFDYNFIEAESVGLFIILLCRVSNIFAIKQTRILHEFI